MTSLKQLIEKKAVVLVDAIVDGKEYSADYVKLSDVLGLLANFMCIPRKQLEEHLKFATMYKLPSDYSEKAKFILKLLEDSKKKEQP